MSTAAAVIREARVRAGMTQEQLARRAGVRQPNVAAYERAQRRPSPAMVERLLAAARPRPSVALDAHRDEIRQLAQQNRVSNVRVFGSVARRTDAFDSDLDLLVTPDDDASLLDLAMLVDDLETLLGVRVDVVTDRALLGRDPTFAVDAVPI